MSNSSSQFSYQILKWVWLLSRIISSIMRVVIIMNGHSQVMHYLKLCGIHWPALYIKRVEASKNLKPPSNLLFDALSKQVKGVNLSGFQQNGMLAMASSEQGGIAK